MVFGSTYCYDNPSALKSQLQQRFHRLPKAQYEFLFSLSYSLYSTPNMVLPFCGGLLVDKFGVSSVALVLSLLLLAGQVVVAIGCAWENFYLILAGRMLFGLGGETIPSFWLIALSYVSFYAVVGPFNNVASSVLLERDYFQQPPPLCQRCGLGYYTTYCDAISPHCPAVPPFAWPLPLLSKNCSIATAFDQFRCSKSPPYIQDEDINCDDLSWREGPFTHNYCATKSLAEVTATEAMSVMPLIVAMVAPLSGTIVDAVGLRLLLALFADVLLLTAHMALTFTKINAHGVLAGLGIGAYVVDPTVVGTAFGAITAFSVRASIGAHLRPDYYSCIELRPRRPATLVLGLCLNCVDIARGHVLNRKVLRAWQSPLRPATCRQRIDLSDQPLLADDDEDGTF
ncbi:hypothetical protein DYB32_005877 [Aphanomyces invadans]|uniref:Major facilitator superfamily (MFS) profile domain-containing protein n=1 Tax=Aphanomyces invadans TaxID=157072 RepID=A0A3R6YXG7_9STRA|nr:hypothetical protein DYB32_005877 [Aphanomyces invadans]